MIDDNVLINFEKKNFAFFSTEPSTILATTKNSTRILIFLS